MKTFKIKEEGKKFLTILRSDGYYVQTVASKNKKSALRKGEEWISGKRTGFYKYITPYGEYLNTIKSLKGRNE